MSRALVVGIQNVDYVSKRTNRRVLGKQVYFICPLDDRKGVGNACGSEFIPDSINTPISINDEIEFYYNKYGSVASVTVIQ